MKCLRNINNQETVRVSDAEASRLVDTGNFRYISKSEWRG